MRRICKIIEEEFCQNQSESKSQSNQSVTKSMGRTEALRDLSFLKKPSLISTSKSE